MIDYKLDGPTRNALDTQTGNKSGVAYWYDGTYYITNEEHLTFLASLGIYSLDVPSLLTTIKNLAINSNIENNDLEKILGRNIQFNDLLDVRISNLLPGQLLVVDTDGKITNRPKADFQDVRSSILFNTTGLGEEDDEDDDDDEDEHNNAITWNTIEELELISNSTEISKYRVMANLVASVKSNNRNFYFSIFVNSTERTEITQEFRFNRKNDEKSITIIEYIDNISPGDKISVRVKKGSGNSTTLSINRRSFSIEEIIQ